MRRAIIADICANLVALEAVLVDIDKQSVDEIVCLGGILGFGPDPVECLDLVRVRCTWSLLGSSDVNILVSDPIGVNDRIKGVLAWQKSLLKPKWYSLPSSRSRWKWLEKLEGKRIEGSVAHVYATLRDPIFDCFGPEDFRFWNGAYSQGITDVFSRVNHICFCALTHRPGAVIEGGDWKRPNDMTNNTHSIEGLQKTIINVGSVGQPRDSNPQSCYVVYDSDKNVVQFRRVAYDIAVATARFKQHPEIDERFWMRLEKGV